MIKKVDAIHSLNPGVTFSFEHEKGIIEWGSDEPQPTEAEIDNEFIRLKAEYDAQEYARNRKAEYDALNQFEMQYDDKLNGTTTWDDAIEAIKAKYPKP
jgi:hypothetical protein